MSRQSVGGVLFIAVSIIAGLVIGSLLGLTVWLL